METLLNIESANRRGQIQRLQQRLAGADLVIGRSTRAQIHLADPRVALEHARITLVEGAATIAALGGQLRINDRSTVGATLAQGDRVDIGPFVIRIDEPVADFALALTLQTQFAPATDREILLARLLSQPRPASKRRLSYELFLAVLLVFLALPIAWDAIHGWGMRDHAHDNNAKWVEISRLVSDKVLQSWNPGPLSRSHQTFHADCRRCHQVQDQDPFVSQLPIATQVMDQACLACHRSLGEHVPRAALADTAKGQAFAETRCAACHRDHKDEKMAPRLDALCGLCHADIKSVSVRAASRNVTDFSFDHPRFRISPINADTAEVERSRLDSGVKERSNLKFDHKLHLARAGIRSPSGRRRLECADCHEPADDGRLIAPVTMQRHCSECHSLKFDCSREQRADPLECRSGAREVPHGPVESVAATLREFYARHALGDAPPDAGVPPDLPRVRPGAVLPYDDRQNVLAISDRLARRALDELFAQLNVCSTCHHVTRTSKAPGWDVAPIRFTQVWMPAARFTHFKHNTMDCDSCHKVADSTSAADIAMPDVEVCQQCHAGGKPVLGKVTSDCATCHKFHGGHDLWNPMLQTQAKIRRASP